MIMSGLCEAVKQSCGAPGEISARSSSALDLHRGRRRAEEREQVVARGADQVAPAVRHAGLVGAALVVGPPAAAVGLRELPLVALPEARVPDAVEPRQVVGERALAQVRLPRPARARTAAAAAAGETGAERALRWLGGASAVSGEGSGWKVRCGVPRVLELDGVDGAPPQRALHPPHHEGVPSGWGKSVRVGVRVRGEGEGLGCG